MKLFSVVLFAGLVAIVCAQGGNIGDLMALAKKCAEENGANIMALNGAMGNPNPDSKVKCTFSCICEKTGVMKADGSPNKAGANALMEKLGKMAKVFTPFLDMCMRSMKAGLPKCESAWSAVKCVMSKMGKRKQ